MAFRQNAVPQTGGPSDPPAFNLQVGRSLRMHGRLALLVGLGMALLLVSIALLLPRLYTAQSVVYVEPVVARNLNDLGSPGFDQFRYNSYLDQQMQTVVRTDILTAALKSLPPGTWRKPDETEEEAVKRLAKKLVVERLLTSYQISIKLSDSKPEEATALVNAVTAAYLKGGLKDELEHSDGRLQLLTEERQRVRDELDADRKEQAALGASMGQANPIQTLENPFDASTANIRTQLQTARQQRDMAQAQLESVSGEGADHRSGLAASADELIASDAGLSAEKSAVSARRVVLRTTMAGLTPSNPQYKQAQDELADLDRRLEAKTAEVRERAERRIQAKLRTELRRTAEVEATLNAQLADETAKAAGAGPKLQRAQELAADIARLTARYTTIDEACNALEIVTNGPGMAHLALAAQVPTNPEPGNSVLFLLAALPCGLLCGLSSAIVARYRDGRTYLGSDLAEAAGFAPLAVLPAREVVSAQVTDEYVLRLAAGIEDGYRSAGARSFVVTAVSGDTPVTALIGDVARKLEDLRLRVRVLQTSELMVASPETREPSTVQSALLASAGKSATPAGEGIASAKLDRMKGESDIVLIEAAPLLHSAETEYAVRCADATILVVESGTTEKAEIAEATTLLARLNVQGVAAVLDGVRPENADAAFRRSIQAIEQRNLVGSVDFKAKRHREPPAQPTPPFSAPVTPEEPVDARPAMEVGRLSGNRAAGPEPSIEPLIEVPIEAAVGPRSVFIRPRERQHGREVGLETANLLELSRPMPEPVADSPIVELAIAGDPAPVGRFMGEQDTIQPVPSYTRSKIRLAFKEQEVNSKTTWFSKLFRGGSSGSFRVVPESDAPGGETPDTGSPSTLPLDPDVKNLMNRIKPKGEFTVSPLVAEYKAKIQAKAEATALATSHGPAGLPVPFFERRFEPREFELNDSPMPMPELAEPMAEEEAVLLPSQLAPTRPHPEPIAAALPVEWTPAAEDWLRSLNTPSLEAVEDSKVEPSVEWTPSHCTEPFAAPVPEPRPLRPLTFQQLAGQEPIPVPIPVPIAAPIAPAVVVRQIAPIVPAFEPYPEGTLAARWPSREPEVAATAQPDVWDTGIYSIERTVPAPPPHPEPVLKLVSVHSEVPSDIPIAPNPATWEQSLGRRSMELGGPNGEQPAPGLTRKWALLSQFEPNLSDPSPAPRRRSTDLHAQPTEEG